MSIRPFTDRQGRQRFTVDYYEDGRKSKRVRVDLPPQINTQELAEKVLRNWKGESVELTPEDAGALVKDLFPKYLTYYKLHQEPTTLADLEGCWKNHIEKILGQVRVEKIGISHIDLYKQVRKSMNARYRKRPVSNRTVNKELSYFSGFLRWLEDNGTIKQRQFRIRALKYKRPKPIILSPAEVLGIFNAAEPKYAAFLIGLYVQGLRFREVQRLEWENLDYENDSLKVLQKGGSEKVLPLLPIFKKALERIKSKRAQGMIFKSSRRTKKGTVGPIVDIRKALARAAKKAGVTKHVHPHLFRHSIATLLTIRGVQQKIIQGFMGHLDRESTDWYQHIEAEHLKAASDVISKELTMIEGRKLPETKGENIDSEEITDHNGNGNQIDTFPEYG